MCAYIISKYMYIYIYLYNVYKYALINPYIPYAVCAIYTYAICRFMIWLMCTSSRCAVKPTYDFRTAHDYDYNKTNTWYYQTQQQSRLLQQQQLPPRRPEVCPTIFSFQPVASFLFRLLLDLPIKFAYIWNWSAFPKCLALRKCILIKQIMITDLKLTHNFGNALCIDCFPFV